MTPALAFTPAEVVRMNEAWLSTSAFFPASVVLSAYERHLARQLAQQERDIQEVLDQALAAGALPGEVGVVLVCRRDHSRPGGRTMVPRLA